MSLAGGLLSFINDPIFGLEVTNRDNAARKIGVIEFSSTPSVPSTLRY